MTGTQVLSPAMAVLSLELDPRVSVILDYNYSIGMTETFDSSYRLTEDALISSLKICNENSSIVLFNPSNKSSIGNIVNCCLFYSIVL